MLAFTNTRFSTCTILRLELFPSHFAVKYVNLKRSGLMLFQDIRANAGPLWDGTFSVEVDSIGPSRLTLLLPHNPTRYKTASL